MSHCHSYVLLMLSKWWFCTGCITCVAVFGLYESCRGWLGHSVWWKRYVMDLGGDDAERKQRLHAFLLPLGMILPLPVVEWRHRCRCRSSSSGPLCRSTALQHTHTVTGSQSVTGSWRDSFSFLCDTWFVTWLKKKKRQNNDTVLRETTKMFSRCRNDTKWSFSNHRLPHDNWSCSASPTLTAAACYISWLMSKEILATAPPPTAFLPHSVHVFTRWLMLYSKPLQYLQTPILFPAVLIRGHTRCMEFLTRELLPGWYKDLTLDKLSLEVNCSVQVKTRNASS